jgi:hypothetical protein
VLSIQPEAPVGEEPVNLAAKQDLELVLVEPGLRLPGPRDGAHIHQQALRYQLLNTANIKAVFRIRIRIHMFLDLPDPD